MKAEHRHELKTNELARLIENFPQWFRKNRGTIIYVSILIVVVAVLYTVRWYNKNVESVQKRLKFTNLISYLSQSKAQILRARAQGRDISFMLIQPADDLQVVAQNAKDDQMAALALIKRAEALRTELHYRLGTVDELNATAQINQAKASYTEAIEKSSANPSLMAMAKLGLGLCEEELGNFSQAEQIYSDITANASLEGTTAAAAAKLRLDTMADYQRKVVFKAPPKPIPIELMQPQIELKVPEGSQTQDDAFVVPDINLPSQ